MTSDYGDRSVSNDLERTLNGVSFYSPKLFGQAAFCGAPVRRGTFQRMRRNPASPISLIARRRSR